MIDWSLVLRHSLWIVGAAMILAAWSCQRSLRSPSDATANVALRVASGTGSALTCLGVALVVDSWESVFWVVLAMVSLRCAIKTLPGGQWVQHK